MQEGENHFTIKSARSVLIDQSSARTSKEILDALLKSKNAGDIDISQPIRYKKNNTQNVTYIDTVYMGGNEGEKELTKSVPYGRYLYKSNSRIFYSRFAVTEDTVFIYVPQDRDDYEAYSTKKITNYQNDRQFDMEAYDGGDVMVAKPAIDYKQPEIPEDTPIAVVSKITTDVNNSGSIITRLYIAYKNEINGYNCAENTDFSTLQVGDIIQLVLNGKNEVALAKKIVSADRSDPTAVFDVNNGQTSSSKNIVFRLTAGKPYTRDDKYKVMAFDVTNAQMGVYNLDRAEIYLYDSASKKVRIAGSSDIITYMQASADVANMVIYSRYEELRTAVIYK